MVTVVLGIAVVAQYTKNRALQLVIGRRETHRLIVLSLAPVTYGIATALLTGANDFEMILRFSSQFLAIFGAFALVMLLIASYGDKAPQILFGWIFSLATLHTLLLIVSYVSETMRRFFEFFIWISPDSRGEVAAGFASRGGDGPSMAHAVLVVASAGYLRYTRRGAGKLLVGLSVVLGIFSTLVLGRAGFVVAITALAAGSIVSGLFRHHRANAPLTVNRLIATLTVTVVAVAGLMTLTPSLADTYEQVVLDRGQQDPIARSLEPFSAHQISGEYRIGSLEAIFGRHLVVPTDGVQILVGDGHFGRMENGPTVPTDNGYLRILFGLGLIGLGVFLSLYIHLIFRTLSMHQMRDALAVAMLLIAGFVGNVKIVFLSTSVYVSVLFLLYFAVVGAYRLKGTDVHQGDPVETPVR